MPSRDDGAEVGARVASQGRAHGGLANKVYKDINEEFVRNHLDQCRNLTFALGVNDFADLTQGVKTPEKNLSIGAPGQSKHSTCSSLFCFQGVYCGKDRQQETNCKISSPLSGNRRLHAFLS